jgi:hypothetical protein
MAEGPEEGFHGDEEGFRGEEEGLLGGRADEQIAENTGNESGATRGETGGQIAEDIGNEGEEAQNSITDDAGNGDGEGMWNRLRKNPATKVIVLGAVGAVAAPLLVTGAFYAIGLSTVGPIAGGWFAANMGAGLTAGSTMAVLQSAAMTTGTYTVAACGGLATGSVVGAKDYFFGQKSTDESTN